MLRLAYAQGGGDEAPVGTAVEPVDLIGHRLDHGNGLTHLVRGAVIGKIDGLEAGGNGLLGHIGPVLQICLEHGAHVVQLGGPGDIFQVALVEGGVFGYEFQVVIISVAPTHSV